MYSDDMLKLFLCSKSDYFDLFICTVTSAPVATRPVHDTKSKSKAAMQSTQTIVTKAFVITSFQHTFAYLTRAAVRDKFVFAQQGIA